MIGMHADFLAKSQETLVLVQADMQDASEVPFLMDLLAEDLDRLFIKGGVFSKQGRNLYTQIMLRTMRRQHLFHFGSDGSEFSSLGWTMNATSLPEFAVNALNRYKKIARLAIDLIHKYYANADLPDNWFTCFNLKMYHRYLGEDAAGRRSSALKRVATSLVDFLKLCNHCREPQCSHEFEVLRTAAMEYFVAGMDQPHDADDSKLYNKQCWRKAISKCISSHSCHTASKVIARYLNHTASSCSNERDIRVISDYMKHGGQQPSTSTLHDMVCAIRYGPSEISELFTRSLSADGTVTLFPTPFMQKVRMLRLQLYGRRFAVNGKECSYKGSKHAKRLRPVGPVDADGRPLTCQSRARIVEQQHAAVTAVCHSDLNPREVSVLGPPLAKLQSSISNVQMSARATQIFDTYSGWLSHREAQAKAPHERRFAVQLTAKQKQLRATKAVATATCHRRRVAEFRASV
jgi:hypothetical protein